MAITKPSRSMLSTGISDSSDATFLTADSSENATFAGNLTVSGNLTVTGTTTQVDTVTMNAQNAVLFEGATEDDHELTLTTVDPTGDRTISLPNVSGTLPVLATASTTQISSTPEELNILDGATVVVGEINALDLGSTAVGTAIASKAVILDSSKNYAGINNLNITGDLTLESSTNSKPNLIIKNTNADDAAPQLQFHKDSSSPADGDELGRIYMFGDDDGGNAFEGVLIRGTANDVSNGSEDSSLEFFTYGAGSQISTLNLVSGNVGIGTSPDTQLHVKNTGGIELRLEADSNNSGQEDSFVRFYTDGKSQEGIVGMDNNNSSTLFSGNTENAMVFGTVSNLPVVFATNNTERMQIAANGSVGIGTQSISAGQLQVKKAGDGTLVRLSSSGVCDWDLSIGNSSTLSGVGAGALELLPQNANTANEFAIGTAGTSAALFHLTNSQNYFQKKVGIGTNTPTAGGIHLSMGNPNSTGDAHLLISKTGNNDWTSIFGVGSDDYGLLVQQVGNYMLAVKHHGDGNYEFRVDSNGAIFATDTSVNSISDRRLKENIVDAKSQWDDIKALKWRNFNWNEVSGRSRNNTLLGLIADEVESVSPNLVGIDAQPKEDVVPGIEDPEYKNVKYSIVWMKAMKALQEAQLRIENLEAENSKLIDLENRMKTIEQRLI